MDDGTTSLEINGKSTGNRLTASVTAGRETYITYSAENNTVSDHNALTQLVEGFGGFPSGKVYFSMKFCREYSKQYGDCKSNQWSKYE